MGFHVNAKACVNINNSGGKGKISHVVLYADGGTVFKSTTDVDNKTVTDKKNGYEWKTTVKGWDAAYLVLRLQVTKGKNATKDGLTTGDITITLTDPSVTQDVPADYPNDDET